VKTATSVEASAYRFVRRSQRPAFVRDWMEAAVVVFGARREERGVCRFADGSAVTFTASGLPVEFIG
jgi:hypothetical protein